MTLSQIVRRQREKMRSKLGSSIYWDSVDSSGGSSGSGSRNYVDPWDLENYAYLRRHSVAAATPQPIYQSSRASRLSHRSHVESDYWYTPAIREPGYDAPASVEEIYFRPPRPVSTSCYYHQPIYEDEMSHYAASIPLYAHLSELEHSEGFEDLRTRDRLRKRSKLGRARNCQREECYYHRAPSESPMFESSSRFRLVEKSVDEVDTMQYREAIKPSHITLNAYGYLEIDYSNSWNSLY